jgi:hypothetical protein
MPVGFQLGGENGQIANLRRPRAARNGGRGVNRAGQRED